MPQEEIIKKYWNSADVSDPRTFTHPMGRGGLLEVFYRNYFEARHFKKIAKLNAAMNVLELGCGTGRWMLSIAPHIKHYTGVDFSSNAIREARRLMNINKITNADLHESAAASFVPEISYDVVYFSGLTQYLEDKEITAVMENIKNFIHDDTVIIDRSTINYKKREIMENTEYYAIFRTPDELAGLFSAYDFKLDYRKRSYPFLRIPEIFRKKTNSRMLCFAAKKLQPLSLYLILWITLVFDFIFPLPFEGGERSHDFLLFKRKNE